MSYVVPTDYTDKQWKVVQRTMANFELQNPKATMSDTMININEALEMGHNNVTPRQMKLGYRKVFDKTDNRVKAQMLKAAAYAFEFTKNPKPRFEVDENLVELEQGTSTDTPPIVQNPLATPTYGGVDGIIRPYVSDLVLTEVSRKTMAKNLALVYPAKGLVGEGFIKATKPDGSVADGTFHPVAERSSGQSYYNGYKRFTFDIHKHMLHSELTWEVLRAAQDNIPLMKHLMKEHSIAHALMEDTEYWESQYTGITKGLYRRWNPTGNAWGVAEEIPNGKGTVVGANAKYHKLFFNLGDGTTWLPSDVEADNLKYQSSVRRSAVFSKDNSDIFDLTVDLAELMREKEGNRQFDYIAVNPKMLTLLAKDSRFLNAFDLTGEIRFNGEYCFMGKIAIGGSTSMVDVWLVPNGSLGPKQTEDTSPIEVQGLIFGGSYGGSGIIMPFDAPGIMIDDGFEVVTEGGKQVLRRNDTKVLTTKSCVGIVPSDMENLVMAIVVDETHS